MQVRPIASAGSRRQRWMLAGLMIAATVLFVLGVTVERTGEAGTLADQHPAAGVASGTATTVTAHEEGEAAGETAEGSLPPQEAPSREVSIAPAETQRETVLGVDLENPGVIAAVVLGWVLLLGALFFLGRLGLGLIAVAALAATLFDVGEVFRQVGRANGPVVTLALVVALAHGLVFVLAAWALLRPSRALAAPPG